MTTEVPLLQLRSDTPQSPKPTTDRAKKADSSYWEYSLARMARRTDGIDHEAKREQQHINSEQKTADDSAQPLSCVAGSDLY